MIDLVSAYETTGKKYLARIYAIDGENQFPVHGAICIDGVWSSHVWTIDGSYVSEYSPHQFDLKLVAPRAKGWVNVWGSNLHKTKGDADVVACKVNIRGLQRLCCVEIDCEMLPQKKEEF